MPIIVPLIEMQRTPPLFYIREREMTVRLKARGADHYSQRTTFVLPQQLTPTTLTNIRNRWYLFHYLFLEAEFFIKAEGLYIAL